MNSYIVKILIFVLGLFILITVGSQVVLSFKDDYDIETAVSYVAVDRVSFDVVFLRNEHVVTGSSKGVISYPYPDGSKFSKNSVVAYVYRSESDTELEKKIEELEEELASLKKITGPGTVAAAKPEGISELIKQRYRDSVYYATKGDYSKLTDERQALSEYMNIMALITEKEDGFDEAITSLETEIEILKKKVNAPVSEIITDYSGYFVSNVDGYEDILTPESYTNLSADDIKKIISNSDTKSSAGVGKVIDGYKWRAVGIIDNSSKLYQKEMQVSLTFASCQDEVVAKIIDIIPTNIPTESIVVLESEKLIDGLVRHRVERVEMVAGNHEGIYVPREAIRFNAKGEKGVYVKLGQGIVFKKIDVIYEGEDYLLSANKGDAEYVLLYDDIIVDSITEEDMAYIGVLYAETEETDTEETTTTTTALKVRNETTTTTSVAEETIPSETSEEPA